MGGREKGQSKGDSSIGRGGRGGEGNRGRGKQGERERQGEGETRERNIKDVQFQLHCAKKLHSNIPGLLPKTRGQP